MKLEEIAKGNKLIAQFMGYTYYHKGVDIDFSDCGGIYTRKQIFSKVPIEVSEYPKDDQYYFKQVPNPDYRNENNPIFDPKKETIHWDTLNYGKFICDLDYHSNWNSLMGVISIIELKGYYVSIMKSNITCAKDFSIISVYEDYNYKNKIEATWLAVIEFIKLNNQIKTKNKDV